jgi:hypothetical protein
VLRQIFVGTLLLITVVMTSVASADRDWPLEWHSMVIWPNADTNWTVDQGGAQVDIQGNKFTASMQNGNFVLKGTISGKRVTTVATAIGTDMDPFILRGDIQRVRTRLTDPSNGWGWDRISLSAPGGFYVGLNRKVRSGAAPGETPTK